MILTQFYVKPLLGFQLFNLIHVVAQVRAFQGDNRLIHHQRRGLVDQMFSLLRLHFKMIQLLLSIPNRFVNRIRVQRMMILNRPQKTGSFSFTQADGL